MTTETHARPRLRDLPELATRIGVQGSATRVELGGGACFGIAIATITAVQQPFLIHR